MTGIAILLGAAALGYTLARTFRLPAVPFLLGSGVAMSVTGIVPEPWILEDAIVLGVTFLVFVAGIELNPSRVGRYRQAALQVGFLQFLALGGAGLGMALIIGYSLIKSLYLGLAIAASSTLVVVRLLQQRRQMFEPFGRLVIGVLLLQDAAVILAIPVLMHLTDGALLAVLGLLSAALLFIIAYMFMRWVIPVLIIKWNPDEETTLLSLLAILFLFLGMAYFAGLPIIAGAFVAGVALSRFPVSGVVRGYLNSITDFFTAIFFTALGAILIIPEGRDLLGAIAFIAVVILITPILVGAIAQRAGLSTRPAIESGLLLSQTSEFSLVVGLQGLLVNHITQSEFSVIAIVTAVTMVLTPLISAAPVTWRLMHLFPDPDRKRKRAKKPANHILMLGCGDNAMPLLETLVLSGNDVFVVDDDPAIINRLRDNEVPCLLGDGSDKKILEMAGVDQARIIVSLMRRPSDSFTVLRQAKQVPVLVRVFNEDDAERIGAAGGTPIRYARATADAFMEWFDRFDFENRKEIGAASEPGE